MKEEKLKQYYGIYTDCWKLFKKYSSMNGNQEEWEALAGECKELGNKYSNIEFARKLILETYTEIEKMQPEKQEGDMS